MPRKPNARPASEHLGVLSRMAGQVEADENLTPARKERILQLLSDLMAVFQKDLVSVRKR